MKHSIKQQASNPISTHLTKNTMLGAPKSILKTTSTDSKMNRRSENKNGSNQNEGSHEGPVVKNDPSGEIPSTLFDADDIIDQREKKKAEARTKHSLVETDFDYDINGMKIKQLRWSDDDTYQVFKQINFLKNIEGSLAGVSKREIAVLERNLQATLDAQGAFRRDNIILDKIAEQFLGNRVMDMSKLAELMERHERAGDIMEGREVILLLGETGSGKTTTLQFLAGTTFEEIEIDGFLHLQAIHWEVPECADFKTSHSREPTTRAIQAVTVKASDGKEVVICDVPASGIATCIEEEMALSLGIVRAVHRAKSVRPVLVLSHEGMGNRFSNLGESMRAIMSLCTVADKGDFKPFNYVFTKYDKKHRRLLSKQFGALARHPPYYYHGQILFNAFIEDIAFKTAGDAHVILPAEDDHTTLLDQLRRETPAEKKSISLFSSKLSEESMGQLKLQLEIEKHSFTTLLIQEEYGSAICCLQRMLNIANHIPEVEAQLKEAQEAFKQQVAQLCVLVVRSIGKEDYQTALYRMGQLKIMAAEFPDAVESSHLGHELLTQSITESISSEFYGKAIHRMILLSELSSHFPDVRKVIEVGLEALRNKAEELLQKGLYDMTVDIIKQLSNADQQIHGAFITAQHCLHMAGEILVKTFEEENYTMGMHLLMQISELREDFVEAKHCIDVGLEALKNKAEKLLEKGSYDMTVDIIKQLGKADQQIHGAFTTAQHCLHMAGETLVKTFEKENYTMGMQLLMQISELGEDFVEANACIRRALKMARKSINRSIEFGDYEKTAKFLSNLIRAKPQLPDGAHTIEAALDAAARHSCELRMEVINAFDVVLKCKEQKQYTELLEFTGKAMSTLAKSEPIRLVCTEYYQSDDYPKDDGESKPNYISTLGMPKVCTSEEFCAAQVQHMMDIVKQELPDIDGESANMEYLMTSRKQFLFVVGRIRAANDAFRDGPGAEVSNTVFKEVFTKFQGLIESILVASEASFESSMEMKEFEIQAWYLAFLIQGFNKIKVNHIGEERQIVDELDHRRIKLMLRFENEVSDTMELLNNYGLLDFKDEIQGKAKPDFPAFFEGNRMSELEASRQLLLSLSEAPQLCKMLATQIDPEDAKKPVEVLDKSAIKLFTDIVEYLEDTYDKMAIELKADRMSLPYGIRYGCRFVQDIDVIRPEFASVRNWAGDTKDALEKPFARFTQIDATARFLLQKLKKKFAETDDISPVAFVANAIGCGATACFCNDDTEDFLESLPQLPPLGTDVPYGSIVLENDASDDGIVDFDTNGSPADAAQQQAPPKRDNRTDEAEKEEEESSSEEYAEGQKALQAIAAAS